MALTGRRAITVALLGLTFAFFVTIFADAAAEFSAPGWTYAPYMQTVLNQFPIIIALFALVIIGGAAINAT